ncbi:MAG: glycoside hydrolase family 3 C-terminal domain-containing protein [Bacteroidales bacterium]|nr:glycoside hydrolase family 3 C-terminal domain-containing protein [Bacteroidales bacterium]MBQ9255402.1 glycoside hydrolase family 3 C-terminal domain-containing protein [Bacteroidales bacterium]
MKKYFILLFILLCSVLSYSQTYIDYNKNGKKDIYEDPTQSIENRVEDLLNQMTFEEKQGQLLMDLGWQYYDIDNNTIHLSTYATQSIKQKHIGSLWGFYRADTWSGKTVENALTPYYLAKGVNLLQKYMIDSTRLGIPIFIAEECMHGIMQAKSIVYPTAIGQASTWNTSLIKDMAATIRNQSLQQGINICFSPIVDIAKDPRWSRTEETFGEDTYLTSLMGEAFVEGLVNLHGNYKRTVLPTLKHFAAYGISEGGHNAGTAHIGLRELNSEILPPFKKSIEAGASLIMTAYNDIDGVPCSMNSYLLQEILRERWHFDGIVLSDLHSISGLISHGVAENLSQAIEKSIKAGVDIDLSATDFYNNLANIDTTILNGAVRRVLYQKFSCGLFDYPFVDENETDNTNTIESNVSSSQKDRLSMALDVAKESLVLLENKENILPLSKDKKMKIALIGPNADNVYNQLGDYTGEQTKAEVTTIKDALKTFSSENENITFEYEKACGIKDTNTSDFQKAISIANSSDIIFLCLGGSSSRYENIEYENTGAAKVSENRVSDITSGEGFDRSSLELAGVQKELLKELKKTSKPIILILINGRPLVLMDIKEDCDAILECFYPGAMGGEAIVQTLFGNNNPSARLPISFPRSSGALPCYYNTHRVGNRNPYLEHTALALYPFGYGKSYTEFSYSNFEIKLLNSGKEDVQVQVDCDVTNIGQYDGNEVVQVYVRKLYSDYAQNEKNLRGFAKKMIPKGQTTHFTINIDNDSFREWNIDATDNYFSFGDYEIMICSDSQTIIYSQTINISRKIAP